MNGLVVYDGPSQWDGAPIVTIVTGIGRSSSNPKTGDMLQSWILLRDVHPYEGVVSGLDESICGHCRHRRNAQGHRSCYVSMNAPGAIWKAFHAGKYEAVDPEEAGEWIGGLRPARRRKLRIGAYGDPAMVPPDVWRSLVRHCTLTTGYTHQWRTMPTVYREFCMASVDTPKEAADAAALGYRTFRCTSSGDDLLKDEIVCPASEEAGKLTTCEDCGLCAGSMEGRSNRIPMVAITVHGRGAKYFGDQSPVDRKESLVNAD